MNMNLTQLSEALLSEIAILSKDYTANKKVYDEAFKKALPLWEAKASKKSLKPIGVSEAEKILNNNRVFGKASFQAFEKLNQVKVGKWILFVGNILVQSDGNLVINKRGAVNSVIVLTQKINGKVAFKRYPYKRFLNWDSSKVK